MNNTNFHFSLADLRGTLSRARGPVLAASLAAALGAPGLALAQAPYATPEAAADALIRSIATSDRDALTLVLGKNWRQLMPIDGVDAENVITFLEKAGQSRSVSVKGTRGDLVVGKDPWVLPIPIVRAADNQWRFDPVGARALIAERRIGANERAAMQAVQAYVDAQREYATADRDGDGVLEYAQKLPSSPGQRDGLFWSRSLGGDESPLGEGFLPKRPGMGYHGYRYRVLTAQGPKAPGGARSYLIGPNMTRGFALVAWPVKYGETGVMSFMVASDGVVFERDFGPQSAALAGALRQFDPGEGWTRSAP